LWSKAWAHKVVLERRKDIVSKLKDLEKEGSLTFVENESSDDVKEVVDIVEKIENLGLLPEKKAIGVDPSGTVDIVDELERRGFSIESERVVGIKQGWTLNNVIVATERKLAAGELRHQGLELMTWAVGNAKVEMHGNAKSITKAQAGSAKIDPLMAGFMAAQCMSWNPQARGRPSARAWVL
jgi:phage terminase large subunit-like protein